MATKKAVTKAAKKVNAKPKPKAASKKSSTPKGQHKEALVCASGEQCFWMNDGKVLSNLVELREALTDMAEDVFGFHVTKEKNDFADWVEQVLNDDELALLLRKAKKPNTARAAVVRRLKQYKI